MSSNKKQLWKRGQPLNNKKLTRGHEKPWEREQHIGQSIKKKPEYELVQKPTSNYIYYKKYNKELKGFEAHGFKVNQLNAAEFQYIVNENKLRWFENKEKPDELYMGFNNFPSIVETVSPILKISKSKKGSFIDICEGGYENQEDIKIPTRKKHFDNLWKEPPELILPAKKITYSKTNGEIVRVEEDIQIKQDITYVKKLLQDLKDIEKIMKNERKAYGICDLSYSVKDFLIIEEKQYADLGEVLIVGYPAEMNTFFKVSVQDPHNSSKKISLIELLKKTVFEEHKKSETSHTRFNNGSIKLKENYCKLLVELHNALLNETKEEQEKKININDFDDYYKLLKISLRPGFLVNLLNNKEKEDIANQVEEPMSFEEFDQLVNKILQNKIKGMFSRPNTKIRYVFFPFVKKTDQSLVNYEPLIYNVRELEPRHKPVLERILELIQTELPKRFNILKEDETSYTNFYTYYRYGDIFHIKTEYLYPTTNIEFYSHVFRRIIKFEELIYSCSILNDDNKKSFWSNLKFEYEIRDYRIHNTFTHPKILTNKKTNKKLNRSKKFHNNFIGSTNKKPFNVNLNLNVNLNVNLNLNNKINEKFRIIDVIVLREYTGSIYDLYTKNENGKFYFLKLEPVLDTLNLNKFLNKLSEGETVYNCFGEIIKNHLCDQPIFKVYIEEINSKIKKSINFFYNTWNFPVLRLTNNSKTLNRTFLGLTDKETKDFLKYINYMNQFYSYTTYNIMKASHQIGSNNVIDIKKNILDNITNNSLKNDYNYHITFKLSEFYNDVNKKDEDEYLLVINQYDLTKPNKKYVIWVYINGDEFKSKKKRFFNFLDLNDPGMIEIIIIKIKELKIYNPENDFLGVNTYIAHDFKNFHIHILHNKKNYTYQSIITEKNFMVTEARIENLYNILYKLKKSKTYYENFKGYITFANYILDSL